MGITPTDPHKKIGATRQRTQIFFQLRIITMSCLHLPL
jgi:hypothetical protein